MKLRLLAFCLVLSAQAIAVKTGYISSPNGPLKVQYNLVDGVPLIEGDIEIDPKQSADEITTLGAGKWLWFRKWHNKVIPYSIDPNLPNVARIHWAINHIMENTQFKMVPRTNQKDYVFFKYNGADGGCNSFVGRKWGKQDIRIPDWCDGGSVVHEILHAIGLRHEQTRWDRDKYIKIYWDNIQDGQKYNFNRLFFYTRSYTQFDFNSIMLYGPFGFAKDRSKPTITKLDGSLYKINREAMSDLDRLTVARMYGYKLEDK